MHNYGNFNELNLVSLTNEPTHLNLQSALKTNSPYFDIEEVSNEISAHPCLSIATINVQSLNAKHTQLQILSDALAENHGEPFDIICMQETWLTGEADASLLQLNGYNLILQGASLSRHSGLGIYINSSIPYTIKPNIKYSTWEAMVLEIMHSSISKPIVIVNIYRAPNNLLENKIKFIEEFTDLVNNMQALNKHIIISGDFNLDLLKVKKDNIISMYFTNLTAAGFEPLITLPTRFTENYTCTLIDNIFTNSMNILEPISGILISNISDHKLCFTLFPLENNNDKQPPYVTIITRPNNVNDLIKVDLQNLDIMSMFDQGLNSDPSINYDILESALTQLIDKYTTKRRVKFRKHRHKKQPWITQGILKSIKYRDKLHLKVKKTPPTSNDLPSMKINLSTYNKILKKIIRQAKALHYTNLFETHKNDSKRTWNNINSILNKKQKDDSTIDHLIVDGKRITSDFEIATQLNNFFTEIGHKTASQIPLTNVNYQSFLPPSTHPEFSFNTITDTEIDKIITDLKPKYSTGHDHINTILIKHLKHELIKPLTLIANQMITTSIFPDQLKIAKIKPIHKKDDKHISTNYRPISLLPSVSKILEKVMLLQLDNHFTNNQLYFKSQYGFRKKRSTELAILEFTDRIIQNMDHNVTPTAIFLDLSKAFDTLNHNILTNKLKYYGIRNTSLNLCQSYLSNRKQFVTVNNETSSNLNISIGVPQGSILGPFFFLVFVNDLPNCTNSLDFITYADDTTLFTTLNPKLPQTNAQLNTEVDKVYTWLCTNKLSLNIAKTKLMNFHTPQRLYTPPKIFIDQEPVQNVNQYNFLGILIDDNLTWKAHTNKISIKISQITGIINKLKHIIPQFALRNIYNALILPHLSYGILAWGINNNTNSILKIQKRAVRAITNSPYNSHTNQLFKRLNLLKINDIRKYFEIKFYHKFINNNLPEYFDEFVKRNEHFYNVHLTRSSHRLSVPVRRHRFCESGLRWSLVDTFNKCPNPLQIKIHTHSIHAISIQYKAFLIEAYDETCDVVNCYVCQRQIN